ncbi:MAG: thermonuclease family protein [Acidobacteriota bacterium]|nr:thermonuclease family protein [Blastocatellia bacterium]MDW8411360.1 thermonuclease family protein [Acidobacteriota bacterium]
MKLLIVMLFLPLFAIAQTNWKGRYVIAVPDGDTVVLDNGEVVKLIGIICPPSEHAKVKGDALGNKARLLAEELMLSQSVDIIFDPVYGPEGHRDKFGRALAYINLSKGLGKVIANEELLRAGAGFFYDGGKTLELSKLLKNAELEARKKRIGIWANMEQSPVEAAAAAGTNYQEPEPALNLVYIRPTKPIFEGPNVTTAAPPQPPAQRKGHAASLDMADLQETKEPTRKTKPPEPIVVKERRVFASSYDGQKLLELYSTTLSNNLSDYRVSIKDPSGQEVTFVTDYQGIKELAKLMEKGTESQPMLTAVENTVGSLRGEEGTLTISTGKDGGINLHISSTSGSSKVFLSRINALSMQTKIMNARP